MMKLRSSQMIPACRAGKYASSVPTTRGTASHRATDDGFRGGAGVETNRNLH